MTDDFEESLRETLANAVPTPPEEPGRAAGARGYSRRVRRTRAVLAVGVAAAVAGAIVVIPSVLTSGGDHVADPSQSTTGIKQPLQIPPLDHPFTCASSVRIHNEVSIKDGVVPAGAVLARVCPNSRGSNWTWPTEPLVTDVDSLVTQLNGLPRAPVTLKCPTSLNQVAYSLTFQYADGHIASVGSGGVCNMVGTGSMDREGADTLLRGYLTRLHDQRARYSPPQGQITTLSCSGYPRDTSQVLVDGRGPGLIRAIACSYIFPAGPNPTGIGALSSQQVAQLNADLAAHATRHPSTTANIRSCQAMNGPSFVLSIFGVDAWGDRIELSAHCSVFTFWDRDGVWYWTPTVATAVMLSSVQHSVAHPRGKVFGRLLAVGGPAGTPSSPLSGGVTFRGMGTAAGSLVGADGIIRRSLPVGRYYVVGRSPSYNDGKGECHSTPRFITVLAHQTVRVNVFCQLK